MLGEEGLLPGVHDVRSEHRDALHRVADVLDDTGLPRIRLTRGRGASAAARARCAPRAPHPWSSAGRAARRGRSGPARHPHRRTPADAPDGVQRRDGFRSDREPASESHDRARIESPLVHGDPRPQSGNGTGAPPRQPNASAGVGHVAPAVEGDREPRDRRHRAHAHDRRRIARRALRGRAAEHDQQREEHGCVSSHRDPSSAVYAS